MDSSLINPYGTLRARFQGGGVYVDSAGEATLTNSSVYQNEAFQVLTREVSFRDKSNTRNIPSHLRPLSHKPQWFFAGILCKQSGHPNIEGGRENFAF